MIEIFATIIMLGILVFVHELGHFLAAKLFGVRVERFSIGFPPRLFGVQIGETDYCISIIPLGGYVKLSGMIDESMDTDFIEKEPQPYEFRAKPTYQKVVIITAGVTMNFLFAVGIMGGMLWLNGEKVDATPPVIDIVEPGSLAEEAGLQSYDKILSVNDQPVENWHDIRKTIVNNIDFVTHLTIQRGAETIELELDWWDELKLNDIGQLLTLPLLPARVGELSPDSPAVMAGLQTGDEIVRIDNTEINSWQDMTKIVRKNPDNLLRFTILRGTDSLHLQITPEPVETNMKVEATDSLTGNQQDSVTVYIGRIGIYNLRDIRDRELSFFTAMGEGYDETIGIAKMNIVGFAQLIFGKVSPRESLAGPIAIAEIAGRTAQRDLGQFIKFIALLSVVLAVVNILPIPAMDGGHLVIILLEGILRRPISLKTKMAVQQIGFAILLMLMVFVFYNDIMRRWVE